METIKIDLWKSFASKIREKNWQYLERGNRVKKELLLLLFVKKGAIIAYFHDVGTDPLQRRKVRTQERKAVCRSNASE